MQNDAWCCIAREAKHENLASNFQLKKTTNLAIEALVLCADERDLGFLVNSFIDHKYEINVEN